MIGKESLTLVESGAIVQADQDGVRVGPHRLGWSTLRDLLRWHDRRMPPPANEGTRHAER